MTTFLKLPARSQEATARCLRTHDYFQVFLLCDKLLLAYTVNKIAKQKNFSVFENVYLTEPFPSFILGGWTLLILWERIPL